ncbi:dapper homolog 1 [Megalops cyprinoides]|uniref:dapper homolog 1 n=1 Tax=Megalops cyprinoides TaxID=118141 RepID=UPI001864A481|nr:dapper homolog 1 [Megalops cyprinoides]
MKQTAAAAEMPGSNECLLARDRRDCDVRSRERVEGEVDRLRTRERLEATLAGLGELEYLRQRQEMLVRSVLRHQENPTFTKEEKVCGAVENYLSSEEKLLEENILLLRKQLNCLRRRDAGLISQLQELDRQISDLQLDAEKASHDRLETDSRPSSGFYELSDGASGSLSNSSNSVFSECLSSCHSSTCFCSPLDASFSISEGRPKSADDLLGCVECEGHCDEQSSAAVRRSFSAPYSPSIDSSSESQSKYHCDLIAKNGNDVYRYPSPLHAVAVQSPIFFQSLIGHLKEEGIPPKAEPLSESLKPEQPLASQNVAWPTSCAPSSKRLDSYIFSLLQKRAQPMRTNKPRTSINTDPSKSILRQGSLCVRQATGQAQGKTPDLKTNWPACLPAGTMHNADTSAGSPLKQWVVEVKSELSENGKPHLISQPQNERFNDSDVHTNSLSKSKGFAANKGLLLSSTSKDYQDAGSPHAVSSPKGSKRPSFPVLEDNQPTEPMKMGTPKKCPKSPPVNASAVEERPTLELMSVGSSSNSQDEGGQMVSAQYIPAHRQTVKLRKGSKNVKIVKVKSTMLKSRTHTEPALGAEWEKPRASIKKCNFPEDVHNLHKASRKSSSRAKRIPAVIPEGQVLDKHPPPLMSKTATPRHHGHGREVVLTKPKYKRSDYRRLKSITEVPYEEAMRRAQRRQKREVLGQVSAMYLPDNAQYTSPYTYMGSDSEYSAECASLFHSTILDTSEDERSNYTTNCFGDSESSFSEVDFAGESSTTSDSEESAGVNWPQFGQAGPVLPQEMTAAQAKAFVKIKASHNLKKKILRFRSGSLKLMTTV